MSSVLGRGKWVFRATAVLVVLGAANECLGSPIWFDETNGGPGFRTFSDMASACRTFMGTPDNVITFNDLPYWTRVSNEYEAKYGVKFANTALGRYAGSSGVLDEGGSYVEDLTGYDGSYKPNGDSVYLKFDNNDPNTPFTIRFAQPVRTMGAFLAVGKEGTVHSIQVSLFDANDTLIDRQVVDSWLWDCGTTRQNYETFFGVRANDTLVSRIELLNLSQTDYSNALVLDNLAWTGAHAPEPVTILMLAAGLLFIRVRTRSESPRALRRRLASSEPAPKTVAD